MCRARNPRERRCSYDFESAEANYFKDHRKLGPQENQIVDIEQKLMAQEYKGVLEQIDGPKINELRRAFL